MYHHLFLANKRYSGWGLRTWLLMRHFEIKFEQTVIPLYTDEHEEFKTGYPPARQFPVLVVRQSDQQLVIWDSLAIAEFLADAHPDVSFWPPDIMVRAAARSLCAEMHSGFKALRSKMPVNLARSYKSFVPDDDTRVDIERVCGLWTWARHNFPSNGPFLFGEEFTAADAFFAPVASRLRTYGVKLGSDDQDYCDQLLGHPAVQKYVNDAKEEPWLLAHNEFDID